MNQNDRNPLYPAFPDLGRATITGSDIRDRGYGRSHDFLSEEYRVTRCDHIVTNPPFALAEAFIFLALKAARHRVAALQRLTFLEGRGRHDRLFSCTPLARVMVFSDRVSMPPGGTDIKATGGAQAFAWFVWDHGHTGGPPALGWLKRPSDPHPSQPPDREDHTR